MYVQERKDPDQQWMPTQYKLIEYDICHIIIDWEDEWKIPPVVTGPS
jgi:hypothetical protein